MQSTIGRTVCHYRKIIRRHLRTPATASQIKDTGLYGFDHLRTAKGYQRFVDEAIERSGELVNFITGMPSAAEIIRAMDEISDTVCSVIDSAELCRHTHPDREFVEEANVACMRMNEYLHYLNTNQSLYKAVMKAEQDGHLLTKEAQRAAHSFRVDLEKGGIHLCSGTSPLTINDWFSLARFCLFSKTKSILLYFTDKLDRINLLNIDVAHLSREFNQNITADPGHVDVFPSSRIPKKLHHLVRPIYRSMPVTAKESLGSRPNIKEKGFQIVTEPSSLSSILQWASDPEVRKMAYIKGNSVPHANLGILNKLIDARHEIAQIMGYKSYADYALHSNMASSPDVVLSFLHEMSEMIRPQADEEFKMIRDFKRQNSGNIGADLEPWDEAYFTGMMKSSAHNFDFSVAASYFPLPQCIKGLKLLVESLFGVTFHSIPLAPGESWHPDVMKMSLHHPEEGNIGYLYLDLYSRKGKYPGCAHFAVKGGHRISEMEYQLPVLALICNFSRSHNSAIPRLDHSEVETLFHEFGHALHSLLSRTDYQHFSGIMLGITGF